MKDVIRVDFKKRKTLAEGEQHEQERKPLDAAERLQLEKLVIEAVAELGDNAHSSPIVDRLAGSKEIADQASVHVTLRELERRGLVESFTVERERKGAPPRRVWRLTAAGLAVIKPV